MSKDNVRCVVLGRATKGAPWELVIISPSPLYAWRWADSVEKQQKRLGDKAFQCIVVTEADYDDNKINAIRAPKGTDLAIPEGVPEKEPEVIVRPAAAAVERRLKDDPPLEEDDRVFEMVGLLSM